MPRYDNYVNAQVTHVLEGHAALTLRSRLRCILMRKEDELNNVSGRPYNIRTIKIIDLL
jgi:NAD+ kinase